MGVGDAERLKHALDAAILAEAAMQRIEADIGAKLGEPGRHVAADIEAGRAVALRFERCGAGLAGAERHFALGRPTAHQHGDVGLCVCHESSPCWRWGRAHASRRASIDALLSMRSLSLTLRRTEGPSRRVRPQGHLATPRRLISHSSSMPLFAFTRARTVSPSSSMSAPVALPSLMRKLQCISETCAPPTRGRGSRRRRSAARPCCRAGS